jgi:hypothetical protein
MERATRFVAQYKVSAEFSIRNRIDISDYNGLISLSVVVNDNYGQFYEPSSCTLITEWDSDLSFMAAAGKIEDDLPIIDRISFGPTREVKKAPLELYKKIPDYIYKWALTIAAIITAITLLITQYNTLFLSPSNIAEYKLELQNEGNVLRGEAIKSILRVNSSAGRNIRIRVQNPRLILQNPKKPNDHFIISFKPQTHVMLPYSNKNFNFILELDGSQLETIVKDTPHFFKISKVVAAKAGWLRPEKAIIREAEGKFWPKFHWKETTVSPMLNNTICHITTIFESGIGYPRGIEVQISLPRETEIKFDKNPLSTLVSYQSKKHSAIWITPPLKQFSSFPVTIVARNPKKIDSEEIKKAIKISFSEL